MSAANISETLIIGASAATIFQLLANPHQHHEFDGSGSVQGAVSGPTTLTLGDTFTIDMRIIVPYRMTNTVVEYTADRLIAWRTRAPVQWRYQLEPVAGGTQVTETWDVSHVSGALVRALAAVGWRSRTRRAIRLTLLRLKAITEAGDIP